MSKGRCLCGSVAWSMSGEPQSSYHCHCAMCRKAHGAAFATYYFIEADKFSWHGEPASVVEYESSPELKRAYCKLCGSVVPNQSDEEDIMFVPAGPHDDGPPINAHIFVASKAPWHEITDNLPKYDEYSDDEDLKAYPDKELSEKPDGILRGSCLCDAIQFQVSEPFKFVHNCHCSRCRRARAAAFTTNGFTSVNGVEFTKGESNIQLYKLPEAKFFTHAFCKTCGSGVPRKDPERGIAVIPLGALDDDPGAIVNDHIFVDNKASWYEITDDLPVFGQMPK